MLTKKQIAEIVIANGLTVKHNHEVILTEEGLDTSMQAAYAAGAKDMQERCAKTAEAVTVGQPQLLTVTETHVMDITAIEAGRAIRALETT